MCQPIEEVQEVKKPRNFMNNPFDGLSTAEALVKAKKIIQTEGIDFNELQVRRLQFEKTQGRACRTSEGKKLIEEWKELESFLE